MGKQVIEGKIFYDDETEFPARGTPGFDPTRFYRTIDGDGKVHVYVYKESSEAYVEIE